MNPTLFQATLSTLTLHRSKLLSDWCVLQTLLLCAMRPSGLFGGTDNVTLQVLMQSWVNYYIDDGKYDIAFVPIDAAARAHILAEKKLCREGIDSVIAGKAYNLSMNERVSLVELIKYIRRELNGRLYLRILPGQHIGSNTHIHALTGIAWR